MRSGSAPAWVVLQLLEACNLRCGMCYQWGTSGSHVANDDAAILDPALALRTIRECLPARPRFELFGGEPLLYPALFDVIGAIRSGGCAVALPTNGTLLEEHAARLVDAQATEVWISLDGPEAANDRQRGRDVFRRARRGLDALLRHRDAASSRWPRVGVTCVVTPANHRDVEDLFLGALDLAQLDGVAIELQSWATAADVDRYARRLESELGVTSVPCAGALARDPSAFAGMDLASLARQIARVRRACAERGVAFYGRPRTLDPETLSHHFAGRWERIPDRTSRCAVPWLHVEVSARGDVTTCHTFYDHAIGNVHEEPLLEIWRGERARRLRARLREELFSICPACCRFNGGASAPAIP